MNEPVLEALRTARWRKSSYSQGQNTCVEVARVPGWVGVRDSQLGAASPVLVFTADEWSAFVSGAEASEFDH